MITNVTMSNPKQLYSLADAISDEFDNEVWIQEDKLFIRELPGDPVGVVIQTFSEQNPEILITWTYSGEDCLELWQQHYLGGQSAVYKALSVSWPSFTAGDFSD